MIVRDENGGPEILLRKGYGESAETAWGFNAEPDSFDFSDASEMTTNGNDEEELPAAD